MTTKSKIDIYRNNEGDIDSWFRIGTEEEKRLIGKGDWFLIESIIQDYRMIICKKTSAEYAVNVEMTARNICDKLSNIEELKKIAETTFCNFFLLILNTTDKGY